MPIEVQEPFPLHAVPRVWAWSEQFRNRVADDYSPKTLADFVAWWERELSGGRRTWAVFRDGDLGGVITSNKLSPIVADAHCIFKRSFWGHDTTAGALQQVFEKLFGDGIEKISTSCFADNHALLGLVKRIGFDREGTLVGQTKRNGDLVDVVMIGLSRARFAKGAEVAA